MSVLWVTTRAAGFVVLAASSISVCVGLVMSQRLVKGHRLDLRTAHEALSLTALVALAVHVVALLGDSFFHPTVLDVTVPFVSGYKEPWMSIGIVSGWAMATLGLSYYARARIGAQRWRRLHRWTALAWFGGLVHALGTGTDSGRIWFLAMAGIVAVPAFVLGVERFSGTSQDSLTAR